MHHKDALFVIACLCSYAFVVLAIPPYTNLLEVDSAGYLAFAPHRTALYPAFLQACTALGLSHVQITWVQLAIFTAVLGYLLTVLLCAGFPKLLLGLFVAALAANFLFSSFHRSRSEERRVGKECRL